MEATKDELYYEITQIPHILQNHKRGLEINIRLLKANLNNDMQLQMF